MVSGQLMGMGVNGSIIMSFPGGAILSQIWVMKW